MILPALVKRYEEIATPPGWQNREVSYGIDIDENGQLLDIIPLETEEIINKKKVMKKRVCLLPLAFVRSSNANVVVNFLWDSGEYLLGLKPIKFETATTFYTNLLGSIDTPQAKAICAYFNNGIPHLTDSMLDKMKKPKPEAANFIFIFKGEHINYSNEPIRNAWDAHNTETNNADELVMCSVTGQLDIPQYAHNQIRIRGQGNAGPLIGANAESFTSYGKTAKDRAADIGKNAAFAYFSALEGLIKNPDHYKYLGSDTMLYWAEGGSNECEREFSKAIDPSIDDELDELDTPIEFDDEQDLNETMTRISQLRGVDDIDFSRKFHVLCLSPNAARVSVRFYLADSFGNFIQRIREHYQYMEIVSDGRTKSKRFPIWVILSETTIKKSASDAHPLLAGQMMRQILQGQPYPLTLYNAILGRIRAGDNINQCKAAIIKAILIKNYDAKEVTTVALNQESTNQAYVLGRLFAVLESLQNRANQGATIRERYFASASTNPGSVFPTLLKLSFHHMAKLDSAVFYEKLIGDLLGCVKDDKPFPAALNLENQGKFILGYYHQRQDLFKSKKGKEEGNNE
ncbi:MAG: type I-C CRISPR-associated protein Cas8c/Csd1 [Defluviitaleaceae bacterium]|nr:type I-C CRISPR-associated protein Cas8c/Csd1 [Defluviitaleaceae bacterium]